MAPCSRSSPWDTDGTAILPEVLSGTWPTTSEPMAQDVLLLPERRTTGQSALGPCVRDYYSLTEFLRLPSEARERSKSTVRILWSIVDTGAKPDGFSSVHVEL